MLKPLLKPLKLLLPLDLQLFAQKSATVDGQTFEIDDDDKGGSDPDDTTDDLDTNDIEIEDEDDEDPEDEDLDNDDDQDDEDIDPDTTAKKPDAKPKDEGKGDKNPTAAAVIAERKKWQAKLQDPAMQRKLAIAEKIMQQAGVTDAEEFQKRLDALEVQSLTKGGMDPRVAEAFVTQQKETADLKRRLQKQEFDTEANTLKSNPFFADIEDHREELEAMSLRMNLPLEQVYMAVRGKERMKEMESQIEQRVAANQKKKQNAKVETTGGGGSQKKASKVNLTADEKAIAKAAGMTPEEYAKYK